MQHTGTTEAEILEDLRARAARLFGEDRALALQADLAQTASELFKIYHHSLGFEDEP